MIFVTVGTHEQPFNRLVEYVNMLKRDKVIKEDVIIQTGFSTFEPTCCKWEELYSYDDMVHYMRRARIVITHGGPASFIMPLQLGKIPVIVPRQKQYNEHVNDHQLEFVREIGQRQGNIILVERISDLKRIILNYDTIVDAMPTGIKSNNVIFNEKFRKIANSLFSAS